MALLTSFVTASGSSALLLVSEDSFLIKLSNVVSHDQYNCLHSCFRVSMLVKSHAIFINTRRKEYFCNNADISLLLALLALINAVS